MNLALSLRQINFSIYLKYCHIVLVKINNLLIIGSNNLEGVYFSQNFAYITCKVQSP